MSDRFSKESEAVAAYAKLMADAEACKRLYEDAGEPLPRRLAVMFDPENTRDASKTGSSLMAEIPRPPRPKKPWPRGATEEWIYFPITEAQETSLVLAVLSPQMAIPVSEIIARVQALRPDVTVNKGSIANIGSRLKQEGTIRYEHTGWILTHGEQTPEILDEYIWGTPDMFQKQELAAYRRLVILHVLRSVSDGLQVSQLTRTIEEQCPWLSDAIPVTKFLVKVDIGILAEKKLVRKIGGSQKWGLVR